MAGKKDDAEATAARPVRRHGEGARERTVVHMHKMIALAAGAAVIQACDTGYAVVDPMPTPAKCPGISSGVKGTATWIDDGAGGVALEVHLTKPSGGKFEDPPVAIGGVMSATLVSAALVGTDARIVVRPNASVGNISISASVLCTAGAMTLSVDVDLNRTPIPGKVGTTAPVTVSDGY